MNKFKKYIPVLGWTFLIILLIVVMGFVKNDRQERIMQTPDILVETPKDMVFLTQADVLNRLKNMHLIWEGQKFKELDIDKIEYAILNMPEIEGATVFFRLDGQWQIKCKLRQPIARIIDRNGESFYIDTKKKVMPLSRKFSARVIPVTGNFDRSDFEIDDDLIHNEALINKKYLNEVYQITDYVCKDEELSALITQIQLNSEGDYELITLLGEQPVIFGNAENIEDKFEKLKLFYKHGISKTGWDKYEKINIKYRDQIVCTKK